MSENQRFFANYAHTFLSRYGNTSSASVPLTIVSELHDKLQGDRRLMLSAFGVGMSWATAIVKLSDCRISPLVEV